MDVLRGDTLLEAARQAGVLLSANCGGVGVCGQCRVAVVGGELSPPTDADNEHLTEEQLAAGQRLACSTRIAGNLKVYVPRTTLASEQRLQIEGARLVIGTEAAVRRYGIEAFAPSLNDARSDFERVGEVLSSELGPARWWAHPDVLHQLPGVAREGSWRFTAFVRGTEVVGFERERERALGAAFDLGTTKIAGYLVDLESGEELATAGAPNPQLSYGEDLISRLVSARKDRANARALAEIARGALDELVGTLTASAGKSRRQVADLCLVGNTAMIHLLLELPVDHLVAAPYVPVTRLPLDVRAADLDVATAPGAYVHVLPCVGGWVGADAVAMIIANGLDRAERPMLAIDIGTNSEIVLALPEKGLLLATSAPSGPALEGAHIRNGMRAAPGAIERVWIDDDGDVHVKTVEGLSPAGICGSGIVDVAAELHRTGVVNDRGHIQRGARGVLAGKQGLEYLLIDGEASAHGNDIRVTQQDIGGIQLGKAAISAGIGTLLEVSSTSPDEVEQIVIAGAFGSYLNLDSAVAIGMLPRIPRARYVQAGNSAGLGAKMALVSVSERARAEQVARRAVRIDLKAQAHFNGRLARATRFPTRVALAVNKGDPIADHR